MFSTGLSVVARGEAEVERGGADIIVNIWAVVLLSHLEVICQCTMRL